jgi:hypothetical protein
MLIMPNNPKWGFSSVITNFPISLFMEESKLCSKCRKLKPLSEFYISSARTAKTGKPVYFSHCKECNHNRNYARRKLREYQIYAPIEGELWENVVGYEGLYKVSNLGRILAIKHRNKIRLAQKNYDGYMRIELSKEGVNTIYGVHVLVAIAFIPNPENKPTVNHKWGIKHDNRASELEWATQEEQMQHAHDIGLVKIKKAEEHFYSKVSNEIAMAIFNSMLSYKVLSEKYNISRKIISNIKRGYTYSSVTGKKYDPDPNHKNQYQR